MYLTGFCCVFFGQSVDRGIGSRALTVSRSGLRFVGFGVYLAGHARFSGFRFAEKRVVRPPHKASVFGRGCVVIGTSGAF